jgi:excisionase family DNA binding protein
MSSESDRARSRRRSAAKRAKQRRVIAREMLEDRQRREWLEAKLLRPCEVANLLHVSRRTVSDWARAGRLTFILTPGGHRRFRARDVRALVDQMTEMLR